MSKKEKRLSGLPGIQEDALRLDRDLLKDRAAEMLRDMEVPTRPMINAMMTITTMISTSVKPADPRRIS